MDCEPQPRTFRNVQLLKTETLGTGSYGIVCKAMCNQRPCAAKLLHPIFFQLNDPGMVVTRTRFEQECRFLSEMRHPHIIEYLGTTHDPDSGLLVLLMELMDESLTHFLERSQQPLAYHIEVDLCHDIAQALAYIHSNGIIHRDLSSNNILLLAGKAKITDFGMSKLLGVNPRMTHLTMCPGTLVYMPPEALLSHPVYSNKIDCFSYGVLQIQITTRQFPDPGPPMKAVEDPRSPVGRIHVPVLDSERRKSHIDLIDPTHALLLTALSCLSYSEEVRPSAQDLCQQLATVKETPRYTQSAQQAQKIVELQQQLQTKDQQLQDSQRHMHTLQQKLEDRLQDSQRQLQDSQRQLQDSQRQLQDSQRQLQDSQRRLHALQQDSQRQLQDSQRKLHALQQDSQRQLQNSQRRRHALQQDSQRQLQDSQRRLHALQQDSQRQLQDSQRKLHALQQDSQRQLKDSQIQIQQLTHQVEETQHMIEDREQRLRQLHQQLQANEPITAQLQQNLIQHEQTIRELQQTIDRLQQEQLLAVEEKQPATEATEGPLQEPNEQQVQPIKPAAVLEPKQNLMQQKTIPNLSWKRSKAPERMFRGSVVVDANMVYCNGALSTTVHTYDLQKEVWGRVTDCSYRDSCLVIVQGMLTTVGGWSRGGGLTNSLLSLMGEGGDSNLKWSPLFPAMRTKRRNTAAVYNGCSLIVVGGHDGDKRLATVEVLDTNTRQWSTASSLLHPYSRATLGICGDRLYMLGGFDQHANRGTRSVLTCSVPELLQSRQTQSLAGKLRTLTLKKKQVWQHVAFAPHYKSTCSVLCGRLVAVGGEDEADKETTAISVYNEKTNSWETMVDMPTARELALVAIVCGKMMVIGGLVGVAALDTVEIPVGTVL